MSGRPVQAAVGDIRELHYNYLPVERRRHLGLGSEDGLQGLQCCRERRGSHGAELADQSDLIQRPNLVEQDQSLLAAKGNGNSIRGRVGASGHRGDDDGSKVVVHLRWRNHYARS